MIEIVDSSGLLRARVSPQRGGMVFSLRFEEREYLYLDQATFDDPSKNVRGGIPILFPICGPLDQGVWNFEGGQYHMPQHGLARQAVWEVLGQGSDWVEVGLKWSDQTLTQYPFRFELKVHYSVVGRTLTIRHTHGNQGSEPMPFQSGLHPYFRLEGPLSWELPADRYRDNEKPGSSTQPLASIPEDWPVLDWELPGPTAPRARVQDICLHYDSHYRYLVIWHLAGKPFWCLEPWSGPRFGLQRGVDVLTCPAGQQLETTVKIEV